MVKCWEGLKKAENKAAKEAWDFLDVLRVLFEKRSIWRPRGPKNRKIWRPNGVQKRKFKRGQFLRCPLWATRLWWRASMRRSRTHWALCEKIFWKFSKKKFSQVNATLCANLRCRATRRPSPWPATWPATACSPSPQAPRREWRCAENFIIIRVGKKNRENPKIFIPERFLRRVPKIASQRAQLLLALIWIQSPLDLKNIEIFREIAKNCWNFSWLRGLEVNMDVWIKFFHNSRNLGFWGVQLIRARGCCVPGPRKSKSSDFFYKLLCKITFISRGLNFCKEKIGENSGS